MPSPRPNNFGGSQVDGHLTRTLNSTNNEAKLDSNLGVRFDCSLKAPNAAHL